MIKQALLATAFAVGLTSWAAAQQPVPRPAAPPAATDADAPPPPPAMAKGPRAPGDMPPPPPGAGPDPRGPHAPPPPPPPPLVKGVELRMGPDMGLRIECGDEPIDACLAAAKPLIDKVPNLTPPPAPRPGDAPPPPPGARPGPADANGAPPPPPAPTKRP